MTKKQIEENAKINHEMELITAEIKAANKIANNSITPPSKKSFV